MAGILTAGRMIGKAAIQNAPTILTISAVGGVGATALLTGRASVRAKDLKLELDYTSDHKPTRKDIVKATWKEFVPPVVMGGATIACIIFAHKIHLQRQAAIMAAYSVLSDRYHEYQNEVIKEIGPKAESRIQDTIAQSKVENTYDGLNVIRTRNGDILFMDGFSGRYFYSSYEAVQRAAIEITKLAQSDMVATLNDFYRALEIPETLYGDSLGWNVSKMFDERTETIIPISTTRVCKTPTPEELPCAVIDYEIEPVLDFNRMI